MSRFILGNCIDVMRGFPDRAVDLIVTDPPYLVGFKDRQGRQLSALTVLKTDEVRRIGHNKVHGTVGESAHHINTVPENESGHGSTPVV